MSKITHPDLITSLRSNVAMYREQIRKQRKQYENFERLIPLLEPHCDRIFFSFQMYCKIAGVQKSDFSRAVTRFSEILGEAPEIQVHQGEYVAEFRDSLVHLYLANPEDCKLIEVEEVVTKKIMKPHPECVAALKALEEIA